MDEIRTIYLVIRYLLQLEFRFFQTPEDHHLGQMLLYLNHFWRTTQSMAGSGQVWEAVCTAVDSVAAAYSVGIRVDFLPVWELDLKKLSVG